MALGMLHEPSVHPVETTLPTGSLGSLRGAHCPGRLDGAQDVSVSQIDTLAERVTNGIHHRPQRTRRGTSIGSEECQPNGRSAKGGRNRRF
jgi:hypothetical protein